MPPLGAEDQEAVETCPVVHLPGVAAGGVGCLGRAGDRLRLRGDAAIELTSVVDGHGGFLSFDACHQLPARLVYGTSDKQTDGQGTAVGLILLAEAALPLSYVGLASRRTDSNR